MKIHTISAEEAEAIGALACSFADQPRTFTDDVETNCADCQKAIIHRPTAPKKPVKLCVPCCLERAGAGEFKPSPGNDPMTPPYEGDQ